MNKHKFSRTFFQCILAIMLMASGMHLMAQAPTATTGAATGVGSIAATLNGTVNANGFSTTVIFEYGLDTSYGFTWTADQSPVTGSTNTAVTATLSELLPNTIYHYRVVATNANGTSNGADMTFTTLPPPPLVLTAAATAVTTSSATLNGLVNPGDDSTTVTFEYGTDTSYGTTVTADQSPVTGTSVTPVSTDITGLTNNTTYHFRVVAQNSGGTSYGNDMTFSTGAGAAPTATTNAATGVSSTTATLNGTVNANNADTIVTFEYGLDTGYGSTAFAIQNPVSGSIDTAVGVTLSDLLPNTTYHYRVSATNINGTTYGADMNFTTLPQAPTATTNSATAVTTTGATLNGTVNANGDSTTVTFQYGLDTSYGTTVTATQSPVTGTTDTAVSRAITGLTNGVTYHYRVVATNAGGTTYGMDMTFTAGTTPPTATTNAASGVSTTGATLNGMVNANGSSTTVTFEYGFTTAYDRTVDATPGTVTGTANTAVNVAVSGLTPNMTYHFRVRAVSAGGTTYGADMIFTTGSGPAVTTEAASAVGPTGATLNGTVNANGSSTTVTFEYGLTAAYGTTVTADQSPVSGTAGTPVSTTIVSLNSSTTYHYRVIGQNAGGTTYGADITFTTAAAHPNAPTATTQAASGVGPTGATLLGTVDSKNQSTTVTFEYGTSTAYGTTVTADQSPVTSTGTSSVSSTITGLTSGITYHYRVVAQNAYGSAYGADMTFFTATPVITAVTNPASLVTGSSATLNATVNTVGNFVDVEFEYGLTTGYGTTVNGTPNYISTSIDTPVIAPITGLSAGFTYHYRVAVRDAFPPYNILLYGGDMTFTTTALPTVVTDPASAVGVTSATLNGTVNSNNGSTNVTFEYGETTGYGRIVVADQSPVTGTTNTSVSNTLNTLAPNTTYHYRVVGQKDLEIVYGADMTFTTSGAPPSADTNAATAVTTSGATLNGTVNANNDSTTVTFEYGLTTAYGTTVTADQSPVTGGINTAVNRTITGLTNNTTYHYRVVAQNSSGTTYGADMTFFTGTAPPTVTTGSATNIGYNSATLNGTVNANNGSTTVTFEYGETTAYGRTVPADQSPVTGSTDTAVSVNITSLNSNITYHFRVVGQNASGTTYGADMTFTTNPANTPFVTTAIVTNITAVSATGGGNVTDEGSAPVTARGVCWSTSLNPTTADNITSDGTGTGAFTSYLTGLTENTTYYVRAYATNLYGTTYGNEIQFTTNPANTPTVTTANVTQITADSARSGGNVTDEGGAAVNTRGVCWSTAPNPTIVNNRTSNGTGAGAFTSYLTNLTENTTYYVRAYATNSAGTAYGEQFQFTTNTSTVSVAITQPSNGDVVSGTVTIAATASTNSAQSIARVEFYIDNSLISQDTTEPYETQWDTTTAANGSHTINAVAYDQSDNSSQDEITVTVSNIPQIPPEIILNRDNLNFGAIFQGSSTADSTMGGSMTTSPQTLLINNSGGGTLNWSITKDAEWLTCSPASGVGPGVVSVSVDPSGLAVGSYSTAITVSDPADGSVTLPVSLVIYNQGTTSAPFGYFETPINNSTVMSSIPVTGWVLDDIETTNVLIYRDPVPGEGSGLIYIGNAVMVDGARPDVEQAYPDYPLNYQAGWGYMLLTNFLPNQGNGTFTLYVKATDKEGNTVTLGSKTIFADNANAEKPFGAIDTPSQGGIIAGSNYVNFGWALTPQPNTIPVDGSTIMVWVDGVPLGNPVYNQYRKDIATLFPGYNNSDGAVGYFYLDTTSYMNGVHTIAWSVQDDAGNKDGVGSRYFTIINSGSYNRAKVQSAHTSNLRGIFFDDGLQDEIDTPGLKVKQLQHVEFQVSNYFSRVQGYLLFNGKFRPLPIGSTLDHRTGRFYWDPGAGFAGPFKLVFIIVTPGGDVHQKAIEITIEQK
jgi:phosphodiesterase/alkaline phosphatase D-like protein